MASLTPEEEKKAQAKVRNAIAANLYTAGRPPTQLPECSEVILALIRHADKEHPWQPTPDYWMPRGKGWDILEARRQAEANQTRTPPKFIRAFRDYFTFADHRVFPSKFWKTENGEIVVEHALNPDLADCAFKDQLAGRPPPEKDPFGCCLDCSCATLRGDRHLSVELVESNKTLPLDFPAIPLLGERPPFLTRLFTGDALWLYYMERMGLFQILGGLMDDYATGGALPIANNSLAAFVLETMVRHLKTGSSSMQRERVTAYRRSLGWTTEAGRVLAVTSSTNTAFSQQFHRLIQSVLGYYDAKRIAVAINRAGQGGASVATETSITETVNLLRQSFRAMEYGRVHQDTLGGIVWAVGTLGLIYEMRDDIGIPKDYMQPEQLIPAAYDMLVLKRATVATDTNRYLTHATAATAGRRIVLDVQGIAAGGSSASPADVRTWLEMEETERAFEDYRTAHRNLTGVDLGAPSTRVGEPGATLAVPQEA
jgi:hypothetical protein